MVLEARNRKAEKRSPYNLNDPRLRCLGLLDAEEIVGHGGVIDRLETTLKVSSVQLAEDSASPERQQPPVLPLETINAASTSPRLVGFQDVQLPFDNDQDPSRSASRETIEPMKQKAPRHTRQQSFVTPKLTSQHDKLPRLGTIDAQKSPGFDSTSFDLVPTSSVERPLKKGMKAGAVKRAGRGSPRVATGRRDQSKEPKQEGVSRQPASMFPTIEPAPPNKRPPMA